MPEIRPGSLLFWGGAASELFVFTAMTYSEKLKDPRWQRKRLEVMERDEFKCRDCGTSDSTLHVHHCHYMKGDPWETPVRFLLTLCWKCHEKRQNLEDDIKTMIGSILANASQEALINFGGSIVRISDRKDVEPEIHNAYDVECMSDGRWFSYACDHPAFGKAYNAVTGARVNWKKIRETESKCLNDS